MKGIILAVTVFLTLVCAAVPAVRSYTGHKYFKPLIVVFLFSVGLYSLLYLVLPNHLGFLPEGWTTGYTKLDYLCGLVILGLLFHSYWDALYAAFFTGFSTGMLIKILKRGEGGVTTDELIAEFAPPGVPNPVLINRLSDLTEGGYIHEAEKGTYGILPKGILFARIKLWLQIVLNMTEGG